MFETLTTMASVGQGLQEIPLTTNCPGWTWAITGLTPCDVACVGGAWLAVDAGHITYIADIGGRANTLTATELALLAGAASCAAPNACDAGPLGGTGWRAEARGAYEITATFQAPDYPDPNDPLNPITPPPLIRTDLVWIEHRVGRQQ